METIFLSDRHARGFKKWSVAHTPAGNDDDPAGGGRPVAVRIRASVKPMMASAEPSHRPWLAQGVGNAL